MNERRRTAARQQRFDYIIVGLGIMGSATLSELTRRGATALGLERFRPGHDRGSSHGRSRIIRESYAEGALYVPLIKRAYELWSELEERSGRTVLTPTGLLLIGTPESGFIEGTLRSAALHNLTCDQLSADELRARHPLFTVPDGAVGVIDRRGGLLDPELCTELYLDEANRAGATCLFDTEVVEWRADGTGIEVITATGERFTAGSLILSAGAWLSRLTPQLPLTVARQALYWFEPQLERSLFTPARFPLFLIELPGSEGLYGFPLQGDGSEGVKVALHYRHAPCDPETVDRAVSATEIESVRAILERFAPALNGPFIRAKTCLYTLTPDEDFIIDYHPDHPNVVLVSACSGHGFKFASAIGEFVADLVTARPARFDLSPFSLKRWRAE